MCHKAGDNNNLTPPTLPHQRGSSTHATAHTCGEELHHLTYQDGIRPRLSDDLTTAIFAFCSTVAMVTLSHPVGGGGRGEVGGGGAYGGSLPCKVKVHRTQLR